MMNKTKVKWIIFRDAPAYAGVASRDFLRAAERFSVHESQIPGTVMFGFRCEQLDRLKHQIATEGIPAPKAEIGRVYIVRPKQGRVFKLGFSVEPRRRLTELQTAQHGELMIVHEETGTRAIEKAAHALLKPHRRSGEWFSLNQHTRPFIEAVKRSGLVAALGANLGQIST